MIAGPANTYAHYVTTIEEYGVQRYEGASTLFGPCKTLLFVFGSNENRLFILKMLTDTLDAYINKYSSLVSYLADNATVGAVPPSDPAPPDLTSRAISLRVRPAFTLLSHNGILLTANGRLSSQQKTGVAFDSAGVGHNFGDKLVDVPVRSAFTAGQTVTVQFVGANPRVCHALQSLHDIRLMFDLY